MLSASDMLNDFDEKYRLGIDSMDNTHRDFLTLSHKVAMAPIVDFAALFHSLFYHTQQHFSEEEVRMEALGHSSLAEHRADHQRILGDMDRFCQRINKGRTSMARAWVKDSLLLWFDVHAKTMDSALAADEKSYSQAS